MSTIPIVQGERVNPGYGKDASTPYQSQEQDYVHVDSAIPSPELRQNPPKQFKDVIWALIFIGHLVAMVVVCSLGITNEGGVNNGVGVNSSIVALVSVSGIVAVGITFAALSFMMNHTELLIQVALIFSVLSSLAVCILGFMTGSILMGCLGLFSFAIGCCYAKLVWQRIPFAAANLRTALTAVKSNLGLGVIACGLLVLALGWSVLWFSGLGSALGSNTLVVVFLLFLSFYWVHQVLQNTM